MLKPGDEAPEFVSRDHAGNAVKKHRFNCPLICDTGRTIGSAYGANVDPRKGARRVGVVIGRDGTIVRWRARVDARAWPAEVLKTS